MKNSIMKMAGATHKILLILFLTFLTSKTYSNDNFLFTKNNNYSAKLTYKFDPKIGFFAEVQGFIRLILYCLQYNILFNLDSSDFLYSINKGWEDYFEQFYDEDIHLEPNRKTYNCIHSDKIFFPIAQLYNFNDIDIPNLGLYKNKIYENRRVIAQKIYRYNSKIKELIDKKIKKLNLPPNYSSLHIRRGDKESEAKPYHARKYLEMLLENDEKNKTIYICTDSYNAIEECHEYIKDRNLNIKILTSCKNKYRGYDQKKITKKQSDKKYIFKEFIRLLVDVEIASKSNYFIGTTTSAFSQFICLIHKNSENCFCLERNCSMPKGINDQYSEHYIYQQGRFKKLYEDKK